MLRTNNLAKLIHNLKDLEGSGELRAEAPPTQTVQVVFNKRTHRLRLRVIKGTVQQFSVSDSRLTLYVSLLVQEDSKKLYCHSVYTDIQK